MNLVKTEVKSMPQTYKELLERLLNDSSESKDTKYRLNDEVTFDLSCMHKTDEELRLVFPLNRGLIEYNPKYAVSEAVWYLSKSLDPKEIAKFGPIWNQMVDEDGLVRSNYGFQLCDNQNMNEKFNEINTRILNKEDSFIIEFFIANRTNLRHVEDTVCNNRIVLLFLKNKDQSYSVFANVVARSIDVMYGLPYDLVALQGLLIMINNSAKNHDIKLKMRTATFEIANVHWYFSDNEKLTPSQKAIDHITETLVCLDSDYTPYDLTDLTIDESRILSDQYKYEIEAVEPEESFKLLSEHKLFAFNIDKDFAFHECLLSAAYLSEFFDVDKDFINALIEVFKRLNTNNRDRKNALMDKDGNLFYVSLSEDLKSVIVNVIMNV